MTILATSSQSGWSTDFRCEISGDELRKKMWCASASARAASQAVAAASNPFPAIIRQLSSGGPVAPYEALKRWMQIGSDHLGPVSACRRALLLGQLPRRMDLGEVAGRLVFNLLKSGASDDRLRPTGSKQTLGRLALRRQRAFTCRVIRKNASARALIWRCTATRFTPGGSWQSSGWSSARDSEQGDRKT